MAKKRKGRKSRTVSRDGDEDEEEEEEVTEQQNEEQKQPDQPEESPDATQETQETQETPASVTEEQETATPEEPEKAPEPVEAPPPVPQRTGRRGRPPGRKNKVVSRETSHTPSSTRSLRSATPHLRSDDNDDETDAADDNSSSFSGVPESLPRRTRGGRWPTRGKARGSSSASSLTASSPSGSSLHDAQGNPLVVENDELVLPPNPKGDAKVTINGELLGGRQYRVRTFTVKGRGDSTGRQYMLSTEPARCMGFRDSYLLFQKHKRLHKIIATDDEKYDLIDRNIIPHSYKGRAIGIVTARSVFREFGARIVVGGRRIIDDYDEEAALAAGFREGELADPADRLPPPGVPYNKNQYVAWHGASSVYHQYASSPVTRSSSDSMLMHSHGSHHSLLSSSIGLGSSAKESYVKRKKLVITDENWMLEHATAASVYNHEIYLRRELSSHPQQDPPDTNVVGQNGMITPLAPTAMLPGYGGGAYEPHTGLFFYPAATQPTRARYVCLSSKVTDKDLVKIGVLKRKREDEEIKTELAIAPASSNKPTVFVTHPQIIIDTELSLPSPMARPTGLRKVPPSVFKGTVSPDIERAILAQIRSEELFS